jgi:adenylate cyclase
VACKPAKTRTSLAIAVACALAAALVQPGAAPARLGDLDASFDGDGIMAVFGAPVAAADHADHALAAARAMLARLELFNAWVRERGYGSGFEIGIGLHSGPVMSGNVGSSRRLEYAAVGDTTNTAARLQGMTKGTPYRLFAGESTLARLSQRPDRLEFVSELEVRGREHGIRVWGLRADAVHAGRAALLA